MKINGQELYEQLRAKHPIFIYDDFDCVFINKQLQIRFTFILGEKLYFRPTHLISLPDNWDDNAINNSLFRNLVFNLGMAELISYWKASCSPELVIRPAFLNQDQIAFWKKLFLHGLGEFFYVNGIKPDEDFISFSIAGSEVFNKASFIEKGHDRVLVPVGGGKDSAVSLEVLSGIRDCVPYIMNPRPASLGWYQKRCCIVTNSS